jgi:SAM-dependent methyltransferase
MKWTTKAAIMRVCANLPQGDLIYRKIQQRFGRLTSNPLSRLNVTCEIVEYIKSCGKDIQNKSFFELGTGHIPIVPIGLFLCGASNVTTVDLNRRLNTDLLQQSLDWMVDNSSFIMKKYKHLVDYSTISRNFELLTKYSKHPEKFLDCAKIAYLAPEDAKATKLPPSSFDFHISNTVLEHIPPKTIKCIFVEGKRILKKEGVFVHFIDLSDHFSHQDLMITSINFLKYSNKQWGKLAGNQYAYCNRMRSSDYISLFNELELKVLSVQKHMDTKALDILSKGFIVDPIFQNYADKDLSITRLKIILET